MVEAQKKYPTKRIIALRIFVDEFETTQNGIYKTATGITIAIANF